MELPGALRGALDAELGRIAPRDLARATAALVERYRGARPTQGERLLTSEEEVAAYAAYRLPATYAACAAALAALRERWRDAPPRSLLDAGAGPGTASWAAVAIWPELERLHLIERDERMIALGRRLQAAAPIEPLRRAAWAHADLQAPGDAAPHDLVIAAYVLNELPAAGRAAVVRALWDRASGGLVLIEPGTPAGFAVIREARRQLIDGGATVLAPCPHDRACPMPTDDWCHFAQRINRTRLHREIKGATLSYEDEKFAYVAVSRRAGAPIAARVLRHPQILPGRVILDLCATAGLRTSVAARGQDRATYRYARDLRWGSALPADREPDTGR